MSVKPTVSVALDMIVVRPGETFTVYLRDKDATKKMQVECRVAHNGTPEVFVSDENIVSVRSFKEWKPMETT